VIQSTQALMFDIRVSDYWIARSNQATTNMGESVSRE
jgi:hypothetical protein